MSYFDYLLPQLPRVNPTSKIHHSRVVGPCVLKSVSPARSSMIASVVPFQRRLAGADRAFVRQHRDHPVELSVLSFLASVISAGCYWTVRGSSAVRDADLPVQELATVSVSERIRMLSTYSYSCSVSESFSVSPGEWAGQQGGVI